MNDLFTIATRSQNAAEVEDALQAAAQRHRFGILNVTDLRGKLQEKGIAFGPLCRVYDICNPQAASEVLRQELNVATVLPCRIALFEQEGQLHLSTLRPTRLIAHFGHHELDKAAAMVEQELLAILTEAASPEELRPTGTV